MIILWLIAYLCWGCPHLAGGWLVTLLIVIIIGLLNCIKE